MKIKIDAKITLGSNYPNITEDQLAKMLYDLEVKFNTENPQYRMHIGIEEQIDENT